MSGEKDLDLTARAMMFAARASEGTGLSALLHSVEVLSITATMTKDPEVLAAAVLHTAVASPACPFITVATEFGARVASLLAGLCAPPLNPQPAPAMRSEASAILTLADCLSEMRALRRVSEASALQESAATSCLYVRCREILDSVGPEFRRKPAYRELAVLSELLFGADC